VNVNIENFEVIFGPGGASVGGWTIHRRGEERCLDPRGVSGLACSLMIECRRNGELMAEGVLKPRGKWWVMMDEQLVFYQGQLLPLSVATARSAQADQNRISFDWLPELKDGRIIFEVRLQRGERENAFDIGIDPTQLGESGDKELRTIITRRQNELSKAEEIYF